MPFNLLSDISRRLELSPGVELLYKFRSACDERHKESLRSGKLYIANALALNDPFDAKPIEFLHRTAAEANACRDAVHQLRVLCFSGPFKGDGDDILRWSHYADGHRGYCLMIRDPALVAQMRRVDYPPEHPPLADFAPAAGEFWDHVGFFKAPCWSYEDERRVLFPCGSKETYDLPAGAIWGVVFGCMSRPAERRDIAELALTNNPECFFFEASMVKRSFSIRYSDCTPDYRPPGR